MFDQVVSDLLTARALIAEPELWTQGAPFRDRPDGTRAPCLAAALLDASKLTSGRTTETVWRHVRAAIGVSSNAFVALWNDFPGRRHAEVLAVLDRAIDLAKREAGRGIVSTTLRRLLPTKPLVTTGGTHWNMSILAEHVPA